MKKNYQSQIKSDNTWVGLWSNACQTRVWQKNIVHWGLIGLWVLGVVLVVPEARSQPADEIAIDAPLLDESHGQRAFLQVEKWLRNPSADRRGTKPIRVTGLVGVRLVFRTGGIVMGQGQAIREDVLASLDGPGGSVDLIPLLVLATERAEVGVRESLADTRLRAVLAGRSLPDEGELTVADVSTNLDIELELGYGLRSVNLPAEAGPQEVFAHFAPCYHGLAFVDASRGAWSWLWPGEVIARNIAPSTQLVLGLKGLDLERDAVKNIARPGGPGLARFTTIHVVRPFAGAPPTALVRASSRQPRHAVSEQDLVTIADRLIEHLFGRFTTDGQVRGTYHPTSGRYDPLLGDDDQAALACYAMVHHSRYLLTVRPEDQSRQSYTQRAIRLAEQIADRVLRSPEPAQPRVLSLLLLTLLEAPPAVSDQALRDRLGDRLLDMVAQGQADEAGMNVGASALVSAALATWYERTREAALGDVVWDLMDRVWSGDRQVPNLVALPWIAMAQERVGDLLAEADETGARRAELDRRRRVMADVIEKLCRYQVIETPTLGPDDVLGGFVLSPGPKGSPPNPDWRNALPMMFISVTMRDEVSTEGRDKLGWLLSAGYAARFVEQLMMDDSSCYYVRDRIAARGGVRMAPWDNRLALAPTAMSLLAVTELQTSLMTFKPAPPVKSDEPDGVEEPTEMVEPVSAERAPVEIESEGETAQP